MASKKSSFLALLLIAIFAASVGAAYYIGTLTGKVTIKEPISWTPSSFTVSIYAGENYTEPINVANAADVALNVSISYTTSSAGNLTATGPSMLTVPGNGSATLSIFIKAADDATPGDYNVTVGISR